MTLCTVNKASNFSSLFNFISEIKKFYQSETHALIFSIIFHINKLLVYSLSFIKCNPLKSRTLCVIYIVLRKKGRTLLHEDDSSKFLRVKNIIID